jgi:hypothetical protein
MSGISGLSLIASTILSATTAAKGSDPLVGPQKPTALAQSQKDTQPLTIPVKSYKSDILA